MKVGLERPFIDGMRPIGGAAAPTPSVKKSEGGFGTAFAEAVSELGETARQADVAADGLVEGTVDMHEALVTMEKADIMLKLGTTVRNKLLDAYQQLMSSGSG